MKTLRLAIALAGTFAATSALAHPGHLDAVSGHSHYVGLGAMVIALAIGAGAIVSRMRRAKR